jgi:hypothetical protein
VQNYDKIMTCLSAGATYYQWRSESFAQSSTVVAFIIESALTQVSSLALLLRWLER